MNKILNYSNLIALFTVFLLTSCAEDKGNYEYADKEIITIDGIPEQISVLANAENIIISPTITSNLRGEIVSNNADFEFSCERKEDDKWIEMCVSPETKDINMLADIPAQIHTCRYSVIDKQTGVRYSKLFTIHATTVTTEGWIILCNESNNNNKVRVDMLSHLAADRILPAYNVVKFSEEVPELFNAGSISFHSSRRAWGNKIIMGSENGAYLIPCAGDHYGFGEIQEVTGAQELKMSLFLTTPDDNIVKTVSVPCQANNHDAVIAISKEGNAFVWDHTKAGTGFEYPVNTSVRGGEPEYKIAPFVGASLDRYWTLNPYGIALLYDMDGKRFIGWNGDGDSNGSKKQICYPLTDPVDNKLFSFNTGMDLVCMLNTLRTTQCIMQDGNKRHIYSINVMTKDFQQEACYQDIQAKHFADATLFAASSQYPVIYYAYKNNVYSYNYATGENKKTVELPTNEEVTMLKFNRYDEVWGTNYLINASELEEFQRRENELIVASYNSTATDNNGGTLRFYQTTSPGVDLTLKPNWEYTGFAQIVDVVYKEVRR